jgi:hypothetical protein
MPAHADPGDGETVIDNRNRVAAGILGQRVNAGPRSHEQDGSEPQELPHNFPSFLQKPHFSQVDMSTM